MKSVFKKYGVLFIAVGITLTGQFMFDSGSTRVRGKDVAELRGAQIERKITLLSADQKYTDATVTNSVASVTNFYTLPDRVLFSAAKETMTGLRSVMADGQSGTPFETTVSTPLFSHGSGILSNAFTSSETWTTVEISTTPKAFSDRSGINSRCCASELCNYNTFVDCDSDIGSFPSRWNQIAGLTNGLFAFELGGSPAKFSRRLLYKDVLSSEIAVTNASRTFFNPRPPLEILSGSYRDSGSTDYLRSQAKRPEAIQAAKETWNITRTELTSFDAFPKIMRSGIDIIQFFDRDDWKVQLSKDVAKLIARPLWPCKQAVESGKVAVVETYIVFGLPWSFESYEDNPQRFSSGWIDQHSNRQLGLPDDFMHSPMPRFSIMTNSPYATAIVPATYVASRVSSVINPREWPLPAFTVDFTGFAVPESFPGNPNGSGVLESEIRIYGFFTVATFIFDHDFRN